MLLSRLLNDWNTFLNDLHNVDNIIFLFFYQKIYPVEGLLNEANSSDTDFDLSISDVTVSLLMTNGLF